MFLSPKICVPKETKDINVKELNISKNKDEAKARTEHISCDCKCKFNRTICNLSQKQNNKTCQCECRNYCKCKKDDGWNRSTCICENSKYLTSIANTSATECNKIIFVMHIVSITKTNTIAIKKTNIISTASINCHSKTVRYCYIVHTVLLVSKLLLIVTTICYHYAKQKGKI